MKSWVFLGIAIIGEVIATLTLKASDGFSKLGPSMVVIIGYIIAFYFLSLALRVIPIGVAYTIWAGLGIIFVAIISWVVYGQRLDLPAIIGMVLILAGIMIMNLFSTSLTH
jgi:small multidrug resistance pump